MRSVSPSVVSRSSAQSQSDMQMWHERLKHRKRTPSAERSELLVTQFAAEINGDDGRAIRSISYSSKTESTALITAKKRIATIARNWHYAESDALRSIRETQAKILEARNAVATLNQRISEKEQTLAAVTSMTGILTGKLTEMEEEARIKRIDWVRPMRPMRALVAYDSGRDSDSISVQSRQNSISSDRRSNSGYTGQADLSYTPSSVTASPVVAAHSSRSNKNNIQLLQNGASSSPSSTPRYAQALSSSKAPIAPSPVTKRDPSPRRENSSQQGRKQLSAEEVSKLYAQQRAKELENSRPRRRSSWLEAAETGNRLPPELALSRQNSADSSRGIGNRDRSSRVSSSARADGMQRQDSGVSNISNGDYSASLSRQNSFSSQQPGAADAVRRPSFGDESAAGRGTTVDRREDAFSRQPPSPSIAAVWRTEDTNYSGRPSIAPAGSSSSGDMPTAGREDPRGFERQQRHEDPRGDYPLDSLEDIANSWELEDAAEEQQDRIATAAAGIGATGYRDR